jgi:hypothetical protein
MQISRLVTAAAQPLDLGARLNRGAVRNAAAAVAADEVGAAAREDIRRAIERANLSARLMRRTAG